MTVAEGDAKFSMGASGLVRKGEFAGMDFFDGRIEDQVALPPIH